MVLWAALIWASALRTRDTKFEADSESHVMAIDPASTLPLFEWLTPAQRHMVCTNAVDGSYNAGMKPFDQAVSNGIEAGALQEVSPNCPSCRDNEKLGPHADVVGKKAEASYNWIAMPAAVGGGGSAFCMKAVQQYPFVPTSMEVQ
mmetsp:Transcript_43614/g.95038  ORF Transcript_43614/g.95038 Transcript_43614/m.95038 type:complete len:146 (+) Transcript_43614:58-495(+)